MIEILDRIATGNGEPADLDKLDRLGRLVTKASLCGLGRAAANPILSTLEHFREEYDSHVTKRVCPAGRCPMQSDSSAAQKKDRSGGEPEIVLGGSPDDRKEKGSVPVKTSKRKEKSRSKEARKR